MRLLSIFLHDRVLQEAERVIAFFENFLLNTISYSCKIKFKTSREAGLVYTREQKEGAATEALPAFPLSGGHKGLVTAVGTAEDQGFHYARVGGGGGGGRGSGEAGELAQIRA